VSFQYLRLWPLSLALILGFFIYFFLYRRKIRALPRKVFLQGARAEFLRPMSLFLACFFLSFSLLGPTWGKGSRKVEESSGEVIFLLDLSWSMESFDLPPSRLQNAKALIRRLVKEGAGDRFALVGFAGKGRVFVPLTSSKEGFLKILFFLSPQTIEQGSVPEEGLRRVEELAGRSPRVKSLVLITDGEFFSSGWKQEAVKLAALGVRSFVVGVGTPQGERIKLPDGSFKRDREGNPVVSRMRVKNLEELSRLLSGRLFLLNEISLDEACRRISSSVKRQSRYRFITYPVDRTYLFSFLFFLFSLAYLRWGRR